jgi:hypothetical protein
MLINSNIVSNLIILKEEKLNFYVFLFYNFLFFSHLIKNELKILDYIIATIFYRVVGD